MSGTKTEFHNYDLAALRAERDGLICYFLWKYLEHAMILRQHWIRNHVKTCDECAGETLRVFWK